MLQTGYGGPPINVITGGGESSSGGALLIIFLCILVIAGVGGWLFYNSRKGPKKCNEEGGKKCPEETCCSKKGTCGCGDEWCLEKNVDKEYTPASTVSNYLTYKKCVKPAPPATQAPPPSDPSKPPEPPKTPLAISTFEQNDGKIGFINGYCNVKTNNACIGIKDNNGVVGKVGDRCHNIPDKIVYECTASDEWRISSNQSGVFKCGPQVGKCPDGMCCGSDGSCECSAKSCTQDRMILYDGLGADKTCSDWTPLYKISTDGTCGKDGVTRCKPGLCCDKDGTCGCDDGRCRPGDLSLVQNPYYKFGITDYTEREKCMQNRWAPLTTSTTTQVNDGRCGSQGGNKKCPSKGDCCSSNGWCGTSDTHCSYNTQTAFNGPS